VDIKTQRPFSRPFRVFRGQIPPPNRSWSETERLSTIRAVPGGLRAGCAWSNVDGPERFSTLPRMEAGNDDRA
jgi:hypothetical protein